MSNYADLGDTSYSEQQEDNFDRAYDKLVNGGWE
jgi:hypothetical protein